MCPPQIPNVPAPVAAPTRADAETLAEQTRARLSVRKGYADSIKTGPDGAAAFGAGGQAGGLGAATTLGASR